MPDPSLFSSRNDGRLTLKPRSASIQLWKYPIPASNSGRTSRWAEAESDFLSDYSRESSFYE